MCRAHAQISLRRRYFFASQNFAIAETIKQHATHVTHFVPNARIAKIGLYVSHTRTMCTHAPGIGHAKHAGSGDLLLNYSISAM